MATYWRMKVSLMLLFGTAIFSIASAAKKGDWRSFSKSGSISSLSRKRWAFTRSRNTRYCGKRTITVKNRSGKDMTDELNKQMKLLRKMGGGTLKLRSGTYKHRGNIRIPSFVCLIGAGPGKTVIKLANKAPRWKNSGQVRSFRTRHVTVMDLTIDGNRKKQRKGKKSSYGRYGFFSELTNFLWIKNVHIRNCVGYGFDPHGSKKHWAYFLVIEKCRSDGNGLDGFTIDQTIQATIDGCISRRNDRHGFNVVTGTRLAKFRRCTATNNGFKSKTGYGFVAQNNRNFGTEKIIFESCTARNNRRGALRLTDVKQIEIKRAKFFVSGSQVCLNAQRKAKGIKIQNSCCNARKSKAIRLGKGSKVSGKFSKC